MPNGHLNLNGAWQVRWADGIRGGLTHHHLQLTDPEKWLDASVPGEVHLDLLRAGLIEEPTLGTHVLAARWVEESFWSYRRPFTPPPAALTARSWLTLGGLDYAAVIYLNEERIGTHANAFSPCEIEVTGKLLPGENLLVVELESGLYTVAEKPIEAFYRGGEDGRLYKRIWLRKPQFTFGWDWSPRLINIGIAGDVSLTWAPSARVAAASVGSELSPDFSEGTITGRFQVQGLQAGSIAGAIRLAVEGTGLHTVIPLTIAPGMQTVEGTLKVPHPELWWPVGHGAQALYPVSITVSVGDEVVYQATKRVGFRQIRVDQSPHPAGGRRFVIVVNGRPLFAKGANWVPPDVIIARIDRQRYADLIDRALELHFNFLRVWGGGIYESDAFYDLCDEKGILVWQEFIFACASYPLTDAELLGNVSEEARYQIRRLAHHPSLIAWCGNNEIEWLTWDHDRGIVRPDFAWFHQTLPQILAEEDPGRYYQPSSPASPDQSSPNAEDRGDQHPWTVGFANVDFYQYRVMASRFPNEGGILGPSPLPTIAACLNGQERMHGFAWELHDNSVEDWFPVSAIDRLVSEWIGKTPRQLALPEYVYYGGLLQGEGLQEYIYNFRRRKFDTSSAIFWMFNDCWPTTRSWTVVDYYLRRTAAFYPVQRAMAPIAVVVARDGDQVRIFGVNDTPSAWTGSLNYGLFTLGGDYPQAMDRQVTLAANAAQELVAFPAAAWDDYDIAQTVAFAALADRRGELVARHRLILPRFGTLKWSPAKVEVTRSAEGAVFSSPTFVWGVCIDLEGNAVGDNFFDVWPDRPYRIPWSADQPLPSILFTGNLITQPTG